MDKARRIAVILPFIAGDSVSDVERAIASVFAQSVTDYCIYAMFSGGIGDDVKAAILRALPADNAHAKVFHRDERLSAAEARNFLLDQTEEPVVAFLDSDDAWHPDHLADFVAACPADKSVFYFTDFRLAQSRRRISFAPPERSLGYLIRQPILLSSVIVQKGDLRFRNIRAEDFIFNHDAMKRAEIVIHHPEVRVTYDQTRTSHKTMLFRVKRTYRIMQILTGSHLAAAFLTLHYVTTFTWRKLVLRLRPGRDEYNTAT
ncbi:MAG: glycosyltransferase [Rhodobacteraceae bacterium]|nr:glycosyltransferase [Paracoccaceae bacterium]